MAQILENIPPSKSKRLGMQPQIWRCKNSECVNLVSDVNQKTIPKEYCSVECRELVNRRLFNSRRRCKVCHVSIADRNAKTEYCSHKCYWKNRVKGKCICAICKTEFELVQYGRRKYCSKKCENVGAHIQSIKKYGYQVEVKPI